MCVECLFCQPYIFIATHKAPQFNPIHYRLYLSLLVTPVDSV